MFESALSTSGGNRGRSHPATRGPCSLLMPPSSFACRRLRKLNSTSLLRATAKQRGGKRRTPGRGALFLDFHFVRIKRAIVFSISYCQTW